MKQKNAIPHFLAAYWIADLIALLGGLAYFIQSSLYAHILNSSLDEGMYLVKGYLFATGQYRPFQDYGPWTNHMPLSYLIPGYVQAIFGPGLRTGRYFAIFLGVMFLLGLWVVIRRYGGRWWAAVVIWMVVLNPAVIKLYSQVVSEGLIACMFIWMLALTLGEDQPKWQFLLGAIFAGLLPVTRLNMTPVFFLWLFYILWENGIRNGAWVIGVGLFVFGFINILFWPEILKLWAGWLPHWIAPFLSDWRVVSGGVSAWTPVHSFDARLVSFFMGIRYHFVPILGMVIAWFLWFSSKKSKKSRESKAFIFLSVLFVIQFCVHAWAALTKDYCIFCFSPYLSFFSVAGYLIIVIAFAGNWQKTIIRGKWLMWILILMTSIGIGYSAYGDGSSYRFMYRIMDGFFSIPVPRVGEGKLLEGTAPWLGVFTNIMGWDYENVLNQAQQIFYVLFAVIVGVLGTVVIMAVFSKLESVDVFKNHIYVSQSKFVLAAFLVLGWILSPTGFMAGPWTYNCDQDVIVTFEKIGAYLNENIPPGSKLYWNGGLTVALLLYLPDVELYPTQMNRVYSYRVGGDTDQLEKNSLWNEELAHRWAQDADVILISERDFSGWLRNYIASGEFYELSPTSPISPCEVNTNIHIFRRLP